MNPFYWQGPHFLLLYFAFGGALCLAVRGRIRRAESENPYAQLSMAGDPYQIAFLRGGAGAAVEVATIVLMDRGLLRNDGDTLAASSADAGRYASRDLERQVLEIYQNRPGQAIVATSRAPTLPACRAYEDVLTRHELLQGPQTRARRRTLVLTGWALLLGVAGVKAALALAHGYHNLFFLVLLSLGFSLILLFQLVRPKTWGAIKLLADLRILFARLRARASRLHAGDGSDDLALLAAIFGVGMLPLSVYPFIAQLYPAYSPAHAQSGDGGGSSGDSGSGGDSGGSSCGGGGGCGGCGS
ncbi:TIGR04222 domain-containing membrane protein [Janthinobacterium fluminis]|uniref:TIGR04222 domain-containing membrane protein n=1 Tax=Janthinobacterium fluminis TaxID=2987524 RepID=A0ABT5K5V6_9BURK|nr:TIGR04222 domain-containing membrane protein [Janthinobacterium fluminis]MDC8760374.1 TIGR04222 domain-containing membrane protein [Janthinobacterium fluminis]